MNIQIKNEPKSEVIITIELTAEEVAKYEEQAAKRVSEQMDIPGFRRGQAPKAFVISQLGPERFFDEVLQIALPMSYFKAVSEKNLAVISKPKIKILSKEPLKYEAHVAVSPEITLKDYEKIKIESRAPTVTDKEIDEVVAEMRKMRATYKALERPIAKGDRIEIDFQGYDEGGASLDKTTSKNHPLFVGEGTLVEGFEEQLVGMKVAEKKRFSVTFPKDFHYDALQGKKVEFETEVKKAEEVVLPELTEDFIAEVVGEKKTHNEFRQLLKKDIHARKLYDQRRNDENQLLEKILKEASLEVPPLLIEEEVEYMVDDFARDLKQRNLPIEAYMEKLKKENRDLAKEFAPEAEKRIKLRLVLNYLFKELKLEVGDDEMVKATERLLEESPEQERQKIKVNLGQKGEIYLRLRNNLLLEKLFSKYLA